MAGASGAAPQRPDDGRLSASYRHARLFPRRGGGGEGFGTPGAVPLYAAAHGVAGGIDTASGHLARAAGNLCTRGCLWVVHVRKH